MFENLYEDSSIKDRIEVANLSAAQVINDADPVLIDVAPAREYIPVLEDHVVLHSGPPIPWEEMCGAMQGSLIASALFEGWAESSEEARRLFRKGDIQTASAHDHGCVAPMAGGLSGSLSVWVVENWNAGNRSFGRFIDAFSQFGSFEPKGLEILASWNNVWAPSIREAVRNSEGIRLKPIASKALQMGDELHNRNSAATAILANELGTLLAASKISRPNLVSTLHYLANNEMLFLALSMASAKAATDAAHGIPLCSLVTAMARNGREFGIRVSGLGRDWFTAKAPRVDGLYLPGYSQADAGLDMGDSAIVETVGWGGFALSAAPSLVPVLGGEIREAAKNFEEMSMITTRQSDYFRIPSLGMKGVPIGVDIRKVVATGSLPVIDTAIAHKQPGHPIIGAGIARAPLECFERSLFAFGERYLSSYE